MPPNYKLLAALSVAALAGCAPTPYQRPPAPVPSTWPEAPAASGKRSAAETEWQAFFRDPRLQLLIETALYNNRDMRIAVARVDEARAMYGLAKADLLPTVSLGAGRNAARTPAELGGSNQTVTGQRYDASATAISYEADFWGRIASLSEAARNTYFGTDEAKRAVRLSLIADVANTYFALVEMEELAELARATIALREQSLAVVDRSRDIGAATRLDYLQADSGLEAARAELAIVERQRTAAANALNVLVGNMPNELPIGRAIAEQAVDADFATGIPSEVLLLRPDVIAAERRLMAAHANIDAARAAFLPKILLTASLGFASRSLSSLFLPGASTWAFQPTLTSPLFDGGRTEANLDLALARQNIAVAEYEKTLQQAFREVADLLSTRSSLATQLQAARATLRAQDERYQIAKTLNQTGIIGQLEVIEAKRELLSTQRNVIQLVRAQLGTSAQIYKALGGG